MDLLLLVIRLALAGVFATAGVAKFADIRGSVKAFKEFGVPSALALPSSIILSVFEIAIAVALLFPISSWFASLGAAGLLILFICQMAYQKAKGNAPDCHCFGQLHSEPVSIKSIARNAVFLAIAAVPALRGPSGQGLPLQSVTVEMMPTLLGTLAVIMLGGALLYLKKIVRSQEEIKKRLDLIALLEPGERSVEHSQTADPQAGLPIGAPVPDFELPSLSGERVSLVSIKAYRRPALFLFVSPTCEPCQLLVENFLEWRDELAGRVNMFFVTNGTAGDNRKKFRGLDERSLLIDDGREFSKSVGGRWTPTALFVDSDGKVASHVAAGDLAIEDLISKIRRADLERPFTYFPNANHHGRGLKMGTKAPDFALTDVNGNEVTRKNLIGNKTLVTFWSPTCPHCTSFLEELREWESTGNNGPQILLISDGDPDLHKDLGLRATIVLDKGYRTAAKLGMFGTPSAVLIDETGTIATETGVGASNIWALIGRHTNGSN